MWEELILIHAVISVFTALLGASRSRLASEKEMRVECGKRFTHRVEIHTQWKEIHSRGKKYTDVACGAGTCQLTQNVNTAQLSIKNGGKKETSERGTHLRFCTSGIFKIIVKTHIHHPTTT